MFSGSHCPKYDQRIWDEHGFLVSKWYLHVCIFTQKARNTRRGESCLVVRRRSDSVILGDVVDGAV